MKPLDLTQAPPRSPREELHGLCMLPRMIDIARAMLPGGHPGAYHIGHGLSTSLLSSFAIGVPEFVDIVGAAESDEDVAKHLWEHRSIPVRAISGRLKRLTVGDIPPDFRTEFQQLYGKDVSPDRSVFEVIETDDANTFQQAKA